MEPAAPPLRKVPFFSLLMSNFLDSNHLAAFSSSTSSLIGSSSKHSDNRLGEENKGHQLLMKMGTSL